MLTAATMAGITGCLFLSIYIVHCSSLMLIKVIKIWYSYFYFYYFNYTTLFCFIHVRNLPVTSNITK